jgi:hypothetical protein
MVNSSTLASEMANGLSDGELQNTLASEMVNCMGSGNQLILYDRQVSLFAK